jgi:hypothetical protein
MRVRPIAKESNIRTLEIPKPFRIKTKRFHDSHSVDSFNAFRHVRLLVVQWLILEVG